MCRDVTTRWSYYRLELAWSHLLVLQEFATREAAAYAEAGLILALDGHRNNRNVNYWHRDVGGEGPIIGREAERHYVYVVLAPVVLGRPLMLDKPLKRQLGVP